MACTHNNGEKKKSNFVLMKLKWIFSNEKKNQFLFLGHNVPITWSEVLGVIDEMKPLVRVLHRGIGHVSTSKIDWVMRTRRVVKETMQQRCNDDAATRWRSDDDATTTKKKNSNFGLMKLKWIFSNEKKFQFLFLGHNVPITWSKVLGVNRRNQALGQSFTQRYGTCR